ncbi:MAG: hypothetical protein [Wendovervirus sonii]|uniref:Peptidase n=1 Tax=phage Lak_Megaphage_Sonny TaxID=3109229 RepID=A0ABZ0Z2L1_9CAUD|nr:MAG: hypothetical protein [phage Lak_Megaphage_Sonny]
MKNLSFKQLNKLKYDNNYRASLNFYIKSALLETRHIVTEFNNAAKYISENILSFNNNIQYSGWNWHIASKTCSFDNNANSGYPIYVVIDDDLYEQTFAYVEKRKLFNNKIILHINANNINDKDLESKLNHEFTHIRTSYAAFYVDPLDNMKHRYDIQNIIYYINKATKQYSLTYFENSEKYSLFNDTYINNAKACLYYMSQTEQEARLNQTYKYIILKYSKENLPDRKHLLKETNYISLLNEYIDFYENLELQFNSTYFRRQLCIAYYMNLHRYIKHDILNKETMLEYFNMANIRKYNEIDNDLIDPIENAISCIYKNLLKYEQKIINIIDDAMYDIKQESAK